MQTAKRRWIYSGLALPKGVGIVRRSAGVVARPQADFGAVRTLRVALIGDELGDGLSMALRLLGEESGASVNSCPRSGSTVAAWLDEGWFDDVLVGLPQWVIAAFTWGIPSPERLAVPTGAMRVAQEAADRVSARVVWVAPPGVLTDAVREVSENVIGARHGVLSSEGLQIQLGPDGERPTALGYAAWAGNVWKQLEQGA
jgi:hypothetical protein